MAMMRLMRVLQAIIRYFTLPSTELGNRNSKSNYVNSTAIKHLQSMLGLKGGTWAPFNEATLYIMICVACIDINDISPHMTVVTV